jgi:hypothetical protein
VGPLPSDLRITYDCAQNIDVSIWPRTDRTDKHGLVPGPHIVAMTRKRPDIERLGAGYCVAAERGARNPRSDQTYTVFPSLNSLRVLSYVR